MRLRKLAFPGDGVEATAIFDLAPRRRRLPAVFIAAALVVAALAGCSSPSPVNTQGARILHLTIVSRFVHGTMPLTLVTPAGGGAHRPLLVFLHGVVYDNNSQDTDQMFAALWLDVGAQDPYFIAADEQLASALHIHLHMWPGGHDFGYWNAHWSDYLGFYAHALATCG